ARGAGGRVAEGLDEVLAAKVAGRDVERNGLVVTAVSDRDLRTPVIEGVVDGAQPRTEVPEVDERSPVRAIELLHLITDAHVDGQVAELVRAVALLNEERIG